MVGGVTAPRTLAFVAEPAGPFSELREEVLAIGGCPGGGPRRARPPSNLVTNSSSASGHFAGGVASTSLNGPRRELAPPNYRSGGEKAPAATGARAAATADAHAARSAVLALVGEVAAGQSAPSPDPSANFVEALGRAGEEPAAASPSGWQRRRGSLGRLKVSVMRNATT